MHVLIGGGSGFIGSALAQQLRSRGDSVTIISRTPGPDRITWSDVRNGHVPPVDAVVNLAGQHILDPRRRWTEQYRDEVIRSRVETTSALVCALNGMSAPLSVFVSTAGKCFYGSAKVVPGQAYPELTEESEPTGIDFPAELVAQWEAAAEGIDTSRVRHARVRIGVVLGAVERKSLIGKLWRIGRARGFLPIIRLPFCLGLGATLGHGRQPFPWIHIKDMVGVLTHVIDHPEASGRFNAVAPGIVSNKEFTYAFASRLRRPVVWSVPAWLIKRLVGIERASILLEGQNVKPRRTLELGYSFLFPDMGSALDDLVQITF
ncbi:MAG: TIGR01777 family oxidoreductase [Nevskiales bacterium]